MSAGTIEGDDDKLGQAVTKMALTSLKRLVGRQAVIKTGTSRVPLAGAYGVVNTVPLRRAGTGDFSCHSRRSEQFVFISVADLFVSRRAAGRSGLDFASVGQASDSGSGLTWRTNRPVDSSDHTCWDHSVCHHVSLMVGNIEQPGLRCSFRQIKKKAVQFKCGQLTKGQLQTALRECRVDLLPRVLVGEMLLLRVSNRDHPKALRPR